MSVESIKSGREKIDPLHLTSDQVSQTVEGSGLGRQEFAALVGCGTSQLFKYQKEGLPPRMNRSVRAAILTQAVQQGVIAQNAALREAIRKLSKADD
jgi:hypothetical protein